jgi:PBSX family phage terminase large subunit
LEVTLHPAQDRIFESPARFIGAIAGIRGGKTFVGALWLNNEIQTDYQKGLYGDYLICAPTNPTLEQSTLPKFKEFFPKDWGEWKEQKKYFELAWCHPGSDEPCKIFVRSLDDPDSVEGMTVRAAWVDECGKIKAEGWTNIQGRLSTDRGRCILTSTPYAVNWFQKEILNKARRVYNYDDAGTCEVREYPSRSPEIEVVTWSSIGNPKFPKDEYERMKKELPEAIFNRRYRGMFTRLEGLVYPEYDEDIHLVDPFPIPDSWLRFGGLDFGKSNPNAILCIALDPKDKIFYVFKEFYASETLLKTISIFLNNQDLAYVLADTQAAQLIMELNKFYGNRNVKPADKTKDTGIIRIRGLLQEGRLKFFRDLTPHTIDEIGTYHYAAPDQNGFNNDKTVDKNNHCMDALRYAFSRPMQGLYMERHGVARNLKRKRISSRVEILDERTGY